MLNHSRPLLPHQLRQSGGVLLRLGRDRAGNTLMMVAASIVPIMAMVGGAVDMGRSYLSQSRLQAACDAGVLAARKALGSSAVADGQVPATVATTGNAFFNTNFRTGSYGTVNRQFVMTLEGDYAISGRATVDVPTTVMRMFGFADVPLTVDCQAQLNFSDTDVMMVLDTTGSMNQTNTGDSKSRIAVLRDVVKSFYAQLEASKGPTTRMRYGFVPYSVNVNVGGLLQSDWLVDKWDYNGRELKKNGKTLQTTYATTSTTVSGSYAAITSYTAASCPNNTAVTTELSHSTDADGTERGRTQINGIIYTCEYDPESGIATVKGTTYSNYVYDWTKKANGTAMVDAYEWKYRTIKVDTSYFKGASGTDAPEVGKVLTLPIGGTAAAPGNLDATFRGCIEERDTYEIGDYTSVDFTKALDLDLDSVPDKNDPDTQWRPVLHELSFERSILTNGVGSFLPSLISTVDEFLNAGQSGLSACPPAARKLSEMTASDVSTYVDSLVAGGNTYHDIGMIWGGRLISPTGLFAAENADRPGKATNRNLIMLTDGETAPNNYAYGTYGIEPLDQRRWSQTSSNSLTNTVENRFAVACDEVKKKNVTVWFIAFGTALNPVMTNCAGEGHYFQANNAAELNAIFSKIAAAMGDLRIAK
jgi:Flp pilus assembly protein TadG